MGKIFISLLLVTLTGCASKIIQQNKVEDEVDVIIIGAGMAGLTAAKELHAANKSYIVLEARDRIGGRARMIDSFMVPLDLGPGWLHGVGENPLVPIAKKLGLNLVKTEPHGPIYIGNKKATQNKK